MRVPRSEEARAPSLSQGGTSGRVAPRREQQRIARAAHRAAPRSHGRGDRLALVRCRKHGSVIGLLSFPVSFELNGSDESGVDVARDLVDAVYGCLIGGAIG